MDQVLSKIEELQKQLESAVYLVAKSGQSEESQREAVAELIRATITLTELSLAYVHSESEDERASSVSKSKEINKVTRRLKLWANRPQQINSRILTAYLTLERARVSPITEQALNEEVGGELTFATNFLQMRISAERNHGKVFDQDGDRVTLWSSVEPAVREYERAVFG